MEFRCITLMLFTICTAPLMSMKQIKLIHDAMRHEKGLGLIGHAIGTSQNHIPYYTYAPVSVFVHLLKKHGKTLYPELMRKKIGYDGITAAHLVYPCPDTFIRTIKPLLYEIDSGEILIEVECRDEQIDEQSERESRYAIHRGPCWNHQYHILCKMNEDPRRFITFHQNAQTLKNNIWNENCQTDQSIIEDWGGIDVYSVIEPDNEAYNSFISIDDFLLHVPIKDSATFYRKCLK